jgi:iron complex outermembrane receptor protein
MYTKMKKFLTILLISFLCIPALKAQESNEGKDTLEYKYPFEVLITAPRMNVPLRESPFATSVIGKQTLDMLPHSLAADEPLMLVPGVKVDNQADGERLHLSIRGQGILSEHGIRGTKVLLDGIPLNDPSGFTPDFYDVQWPRVQSIEVLRGPAASLYGGSASAGIININTLSSPQKLYSGEAFFSSGTFNTWQAFGLFGTGWKNGNANLSISREMGDGYRIHTHYWGDKLWSKADWDIGKKVHLTPVVGYIDFFNENPEGLNRDQVTEDPRQPNGDAGPKNEYMHTQRYTGGISGVIDISKMHSLLFTGYIRGTKYDEEVPSSLLHRQMTAPGGSLQYNLHFAYKKIRNTISVGGDVQYLRIDEHLNPNPFNPLYLSTDTEISHDTISETGYGVFFADRLELDSKWSFMLNVRYDGIQNKLNGYQYYYNPDTAWTPNLKNLSGTKNFNKATARIGLTYSPDKNWNIFADYGTGFIPPAIEELDQNPNAFGGFNEDLTFAESQGPEIGVRGSFLDKYYFDLTGYYLKTKNDFDRFRLPNRPLETFYTNSAGTKRFGAELYARLEPIKYVTLQIAYTYSNFKYADITSPIPIIMDDTSIHKYKENGNFLPNSPEHQLMVDLQLNLLKNLSVGFNSETYSRSYIDGANILLESVGGYTLYGARVMYTALFAGTKAELSINARNIFSRRYIAFTEPDPGGNSYQPGTPLEVYLNARVRF